MFSVDGTPTDCVNLAVTHRPQGPARPRRLGHQQGLQHRRRRDVLGNGGGRARGGAAGDSGHGGVAARAGVDVRLRRTPRRAALTVAEALLRHRSGRARVPERQRAARPHPRLPHGGAGAAEPRHVGQRARRPARRATTTGSTKAQDDWQPHDRLGLPGGASTGMVAVTPLQPDLTAHAQLRHVEAMGLPAANARGPRDRGEAETVRRAEDRTDDSCFALDGGGRGRVVSSGCRGVAQPGRALGSGPRGRRFESSRPDQ